MCGWVPLLRDGGSTSTGCIRTGRSRSGRRRVGWRDGTLRAYQIWTRTTNVDAGHSTRERAYRRRMSCPWYVQVPVLARNSVYRNTLRPSWLVVFGVVFVFSWRPRIQWVGFGGTTTTTPIHQSIIQNTIYIYIYIYTVSSIKSNHYIDTYLLLLFDIIIDHSLRS